MQHNYKRGETLTSSAGLQVTKTPLFRKHT